MNESEKRQYEIAFLSKEEETIPDLLRMIQAHGAEISFEGVCKRVRLAYPIKGEESAYFGYFHFSNTPDKAELLDKDLRLSGKVLRFLITSPPVSKQDKRQTVMRHREESVIASGAISAPQKTETLPLSNEELEKKIDEILQ